MFLEPTTKKSKRCTKNINRHGLFDQIWMGMFENLIAYKDQHKITMVPQHYDEDPKLGKWVCTQRQYYKNDELLPKRYALLKSIGFQLDEAREAREQTIWMNMMFQKLVKYKKLHKNTNLHGRSMQSLS